MIPSCSLLAAAQAAGGGGGGGGVPTISLTTTSVSKNAVGTATASYSVDADGTVHKNGALAVFENWISDATQAGNYDVMATLASGTTPDTGTLGSWLALTADASWSLVNASGTGNTVSSVLTVKIREHASGTVKATATITMSATSTGTP